MTDAFLESLRLEGSAFGRVGALPPQPPEWDREAGWEQLNVADRNAVRARLAIEAAVGELVARHPEARPTSAVRLTPR